MSSPVFPLLKAPVSITADSESFRTVDFRIATEIPVDAHVGAFATVRRHHVHEGVDLYACDQDPVLAMEGGSVVMVGPFTGPKAGFPWWLDTDVVMVEGEHGVLAYGEILAGAWTVGDRVQAGDELGRISPVLRHDKGRPRFMLHVERYTPGIRASCGVWPLGQPRPNGLLDPTPLLLAAAGLAPRLTA